MKINFFSPGFMHTGWLVLNVCCIFASERSTSENSDEKAHREMANQAVVLKLLDNPNWCVQFPGIQQVKITQEMIHGSDIAGKLSEEFLKKNMAESREPSSDEEICSLRLVLKW